ncbi:MAG: exodeoxyribonuclease VII large subunit [Coriobacteriales bacterium]|nr:exodeoxyribonuclease VII large subunit [Coriobacteriales bacterium]
MIQDYAYLEANQAANTEPLSVSAALALARQTLEQISLCIIGEISDLSDNPRYKAVYFTLADQGAALPCLMWRSSFDRLGVQLKSGMQVEVRGRFSLYAAKGRMQFDVRELNLAGEGRLRAQVAQLAATLRAQGLMDEARKLPLPGPPECLALVTSPRGKAVHDVLRTLKRRFPLMQVLLFGVAVEGKEAASGIIQALKAAESSRAEVIVLVRGGGSYEDLMPFNDEALARTIDSLKKPVVTGIGHEPDTSLADMVASLRASTPTAAAEAVVPDSAELLTVLAARDSALNSGLKRYLERARHQLKTLQHSAVFTQERYLVAQYSLSLEQTAQRLDRAIPAGLLAALAWTRASAQRLRGAGAALFSAHKAVLQHLQPGLIHGGTALTHRYDKAIIQAAASLESLSPLAVLSRGYALAYDKNARILLSADQVEKGDQIQVNLAQGSLKAQVTAIEGTQQ